MICPISLYGRWEDSGMINRIRYNNASAKGMIDLFVDVIVLIILSNIFIKVIIYFTGEQ